MPTIPLTTSISVELILNLTGLAEVMNSANSDDPTDVLAIDDIAIEAVLWDTRDADGRILTHDILADVDTTSPDVQRLLSNLLTCVEPAAREALEEEVDAQ